jgi:Tfp pilus assembly protein PilW
VVGAVGLQTSEQYTDYNSTSSPLSYTVSNSTSFTVIMISCVRNSPHPCSIPDVPSGCTKLFATSYGNKTSYTIGRASVYGAVCYLQKAGTYLVAVQNYTYYAAAAYVYHG